MLDFLCRLFQRVRGIVDANEIDVRIDHSVEREQCRRRRTADIVKVGVRHGEVLRLPQKMRLAPKESGVNCR